MAEKFRVQRSIQIALGIAERVLRRARLILFYSDHLFGDGPRKTAMVLKSRPLTIVPNFEQYPYDFSGSGSSENGG